MGLCTIDVAGEPVPVVSEDGGDSIIGRAGSERSGDNGVTEIRVGVESSCTWK